MLMLCNNFFFLFLP